MACRLHLELVANSEASAYTTLRRPYNRAALAVRDQYVRVRGARQRYIKTINVEIPRDAVVVLTGVIGTG